MRAGVLGRFGARVRRLRLDLKLSQERLGELAQMDMTYVSGIERGRRNPTLLVIQRLGDALGCDFLGLQAEPEGAQ